MLSDSLFTQKRSITDVWQNPSSTSERTYFFAEYSQRIRTRLGFGDCSLAVLECEAFLIHDFFIHVSLRFFVHKKILECCVLVRAPLIHVLIWKLTSIETCTIAWIFMLVRLKSFVHTEAAFHRCLKSHFDMDVLL